MEMALAAGGAGYMLWSASPGLRPDPASRGSFAPGTSLWCLGARRGLAGLPAPDAVFVGSGGELADILTAAMGGIGGPHLRLPWPLETLAAATAALTAAGQEAEYARSR
ncbi:MAG: hypothetical protein ACLTYN_03870 [Dysosmobacter welbionis]